VFVLEYGLAFTVNRRTDSERMISGKTISVLITTYHEKRWDNALKVVSAWLKQPVDEVWLIDGAARGLTSIKDRRFLYWPLPRDFGPQSDYGVALLTKGDLIICADDDIAPLPGFTQDLVDGMEQSGAGFVGIVGRRWTDPSYHRNKLFKADLISKPEPVGCPGCIYMAHRMYFGFDCRDMPSRNVDDYWHCLAYKEVLKCVVPTKNYEHLPTSHDDTAMCKSRKLMNERYRFFANMYIKHYKGAGLPGSI